MYGCKYTTYFVNAITLNIFLAKKNKKNMISRELYVVPN